MDDLSTSLNNSGISGHNGGKTINHLCYADDIIMFDCALIISDAATTEHLPHIILLSTLCCIMVTYLSQGVLNPVP